MSTPDTIIANAAYHSQILKSITDLDYVPSALANQKSYVGDLETQLGQSEKKIQELAEKTKRERKEHAALRDSTAKRLAHKLTGRKEKFDAKESKEEREYIEALEHELTEKESQNSLKQMLSEAKHVLDDLQHKSQQYESFKNELITLYSRVFDGPSASFPEDDELERLLEEAHVHYERIQSVLNSETKAAELLATAVKRMNACQGKMNEALGYSRWDIYGGGGMSDMMERSALSGAQALAVQVERLVDQARRISPQVQPVGRVNIAQGSVFSDVFFDNFFTDLAFHDEIKRSATQVLLANQRLKLEREAASRRAETAGTQLVQAAKTLETRRRELIAFRRATFDQVATELPKDKPPTYEQVSEAVVTGATPSSVSGGSTSSNTNGNAGTPKPSVSAGEGGVSSSTEPAPASIPQPPGYSRTASSSIETHLVWGSRNPYAAAIAERTRALSNSE